MKTLLYSILTISVLVIFITACTNPKPPSTTDVAVLRDITDKYFAKPDVNEIYSLFGLAQTSTNGAIFRFKNLNEVSYNYEAEAKVEAQNFWFSNDMDQIKAVKGFKSRIAEIIAGSETENFGKRNSSIYFPIANELNRLAQSKADKKYLIVYSDLMEHTTNLSFYNKRTMSEIKENSEVIRNQLEQLQSLQNLSGIKIYFIYQPTDTYSDQEFTTVSAFYKKLLEDKGATVTISANII